MLLLVSPVAMASMAPTADGRTGQTEGTFVKMNLLNATQNSATNPGGFIAATGSPETIYLLPATADSPFPKSGLVAHNVFSSETLDKAPGTLNKAALTRGTTMAAYKAGTTTPALRTIEYHGETLNQTVECDAPLATFLYIPVNDVMALDRQTVPAANQASDILQAMTSAADAFVAPLLIYVATSSEVDHTTGHDGMFSTASPSSVVTETTPGGDTTVYAKSPASTIATTLHQDGYTLAHTNATGDVRVALALAHSGALDSDWDMIR